MSLNNSSYSALIVLVGALIIHTVCSCLMVVSAENILQNNCSVSLHKQGCKVLVTWCQCAALESTVPHAATSQHLCLVPALSFLLVTQGLSQEL